MMSVETILSPVLRPTDDIQPRTDASLRFSFWTKEDCVSLSPELHAYARRIGSLTLVELKGRAEHETAFDLHQQHDIAFWMVIQTQGSISLLGHASPVCESQQYSALYTFGKVSHLQVKAGRTALLLIGIDAEDAGELTAEYPMLDATAPAGVPYRILPMQPTGYRQRQLIDKLLQVQGSARILSVKLHYHLLLLSELYHTDLQQTSKSRDMEQLALYHQAIEYIRKHYMYESISRDDIAKTLNVTPRTLTRAFEGKNITVASAIARIRIYKARELVRTTDLTMETIAYTLRFSDTKHLKKRYMEAFGCSPATDRQAYQTKNGCLRSGGDPDE